jgi:hypothetical protein
MDFASTIGSLRLTQILRHFQYALLIVGSRSISNTNQLICFWILFKNLFLSEGESNWWPLILTESHVVLPELRFFFSIQNSKISILKTVLSKKAYKSAKKAYKSAKSFHIMSLKHKTKIYIRGWSWSWYLHWRVKVFNDIIDCREEQQLTLFSIILFLFYSLSVFKHSCSMITSAVIIAAVISKCFLLLFFFSN